MINIGQNIKKVFEDKGMSVSEFGRRINKSRENIYSIFKRETIDTGLLVEVGTALDYDFFLQFTPVGDELIELKKELRFFKDIAMINVKKVI